MVPHRAAVGAFCASLHLVSACAFVPSATLSASAWKSSLGQGHCSSTSSRDGLRSGAGIVASRRTGPSMNGGSDDLYIVGAGYLGKLVGAEWHAKYPSAKIYGETRSYVRHESIMPEGMTHLMRKNRAEEGAACANVVFCASPSGNEQYPDELLTALTEMWDGSGMFVFTSSGGIFAEEDGGVVTEESPVKDTSRAGMLKTAEAVTIKGGGCVLRLAGLYAVDRGPHNAWLTEKKLEKHPDGLINLVAYEDAARAVVAALDAGRKKPSTNGENPSPTIKGRVFLVADDEPTSRRRICEAALTHPFHGWKALPKFDPQGPGAGAAGPRKIYDCSVTRRDLDWQPRFSSFEEYFRLQLEAEEKARLEYEENKV